ncbi:alpha,alpha-phosphotrehalase [Psittacicella hinzii]|uniref:Alpha,alpha-phosphotrehalase n=1 Tax=Psittacicella hinzii TaxID=2028575 RepID=A0A3A1YP14_9GAMM|nr:alpha,alpha-phosphotrehalase [Psittacicella hinzii]RIY39291.1 alpha,alpha-phosphotrehalase [Psittacicella hinzii]
MSLAWWQNGVIYQIYPKSFKDSTGSGTGDLQGIISKLDYLHKLGIDAIWLTPIYVSPQVDNGYDIADYMQIDPAYGTLEDFKELVSQAHERNIRIIMDMVLNHTSTEHPWFKQAQDPSSPYHNYYIWRGDQKKLVPNNWQSKFGGSAWKWSSKAKSHYLHLFAPEQADLNWENPQVREQLYKIIAFWADLGIDGVRLDVINLISKDQIFPDDPLADGRKFYTDGPRVHEYLKELNQKVLKPYGLMSVGEMSSTTVEHCQQYANLKGTELSMVFNFHHLKIDYPNGEKWTYARPDFLELKRILGHWQLNMHNRAWNALFWCNHDQPRVVSRLGTDNTLRPQAAKMLAMALHGLQGTPYIYQGEEIGMTNPGFSDISQYRDVESLNMYNILLEQGKSEKQVLQILAQKSRDNGRTPMQWDNTPHAGFTTGEPWIEVAPNYRSINVERELLNPNSVFYTYQTLIALRKEYEIFALGDYRDLEPLNDEDLWIYKRSYQEQSLLVIVNFSGQVLETSLTRESLGISDATVLLNNYSDVHWQNRRLILQPYQAIYFFQA